MQGSQRQRLEDEEVQRPLHEIRGFRHSRLSCRSEREVWISRSLLRKGKGAHTLAGTCSPNDLCVHDSLPPRRLMNGDSVWRLLVVCAATLASVANAQAPGTPATTPDDPYAAIRHVKLSGNGAVWAAFGGQLRERVESWKNFNFGALPPAPTSAKASDVFALTRALVSADLHAGSHVRLFAQAKSSFSTKRALAGGTRPSDVDEIDFHQLYGELLTSKHAKDDGVLALRAGRLEMAYGHEPLVGAPAWAHAKRNFHGAAARYGTPNGGCTAF